MKLHNAATGQTIEWEGTIEEFNAASDENQIGQWAVFNEPAPIPQTEPVLQPSLTPIEPQAPLEPIEPPADPQPPALTPIEPVAPEATQPVQGAQ